MLALLAAVVAFFAWLATSARDPGPLGTKAPPAVQAASKSEVRQAPLFEAPRPPPPAKAMSLPPGWESLAGLDVSASAAQARLRHIQMRRAYPLWTQPLDPANVWTPPEPYQGSSSDRNTGGRIFVVPERAQVKVGTPVRFFVQAIDADGAPTPIDALAGGTASAWYGRTPHPRIEVAFGDDGAGGDDRARDLVYTGVLSLPAGRASAGDWTFGVEGIVGGERLGATTTVLVVPDDSVFTGEFSEELVAGSLVVHAGVEIVRPAFTHVRLELFAGDRPIAQAWAAQTPDAAGPRTFDVTFYGKVIRDAGAAGPFTVRHAILTTQTEDGRFPGTVVDPVLVTRPYPVSAFTDRNKNGGNALLAEQERLALEDIEAAKQGGPDPNRPPRTTSIDKYKTPTPE